MNNHRIPNVFLARVVLSTAARGGDRPASSVASASPVMDQVRPDTPLIGTQAAAATDVNARPGIGLSLTSSIGRPFSKE